MIFYKKYFSTKQIKSKLQSVICVVLSSRRESKWEILFFPLCKNLNVKTRQLKSLIECFFPKVERCPQYCLDLICGCMRMSVVVSVITNDINNGHHKQVSKYKQVKKEK